MTTVKLKNGSEEVGSVVVITMRVLNGLMDEGKYMVVYDLIELCKNPDNQRFVNTGEDLEKLNLAHQQDGQWYVHGTIRNIVLSAVQGEGLDLHLGSPILRGKEKNNDNEPT